MVLDYKLYLERSENELKLARIIFKISNNNKIQLNVFNIAEPETYYSSVISHSYFSIFYSAKAYLTKKRILTKAPEEHRKTFEEFKKFVEKGEIDLELLKIYKKLLVRADTLLGIFSREKKKRGHFTYKTLPQSNKEPAKESIERARTFFKHIYNLTQS
ncbi:MAG: hypothetical protein KKA79_07915 [Nanoarchaeota archaeon]|nr:hypothetical protein [Nanoarchaeota archaeon]MCG2717682.1 hypothetical protein [Nanoarchaeota archaeon]